MPWPTFAVNATGCFFIGVLMATLSGIARPHPLLRPFLGIGLLGGFTTFSTYAVQVDALVRDGQPVPALGYLAGTVVAAVLAVLAGTVLVRAVSRRLTRREAVSS